MMSKAQLISAALYLLSLNVWAEQAAVVESVEQLAWKTVDEGDDDFEQRAQELQEWLHQREEARQMGGHPDSVQARPGMNSSPRYFEERGYDAQGYKRLNENTRFRLRDVPLPRMLLREPREYSGESLLRRRSHVGSDFNRSRRAEEISPAEPQKLRRAPLIRHK